MASKALEEKITVTGPLADILGTKTVKRKDLMKKLYKGKNGVDKLGLKGEKGDGYTVKVKGRTYKGGQIIHCGEDPDWKKMCGGKKMISMTQLLSYAYKYVK